MVAVSQTIAVIPAQADRHQRAHRGTGVTGVQLAVVEQPAAQPTGHHQQDHLVQRRRVLLADAAQRVGIQPQQRRAAVR
jgi:hypothetical protein